MTGISQIHRLAHMYTLAYTYHKVGSANKFLFVLGSSSDKIMVHLQISLCKNTACDPFISIHTGNKSQVALSKRPKKENHYRESC